MATKEVVPNNIKAIKKKNPVQQTLFAMKPKSSMKQTLSMNG